MVVPANTTVVLVIQATDVIHNWWVPSLGGKVDAVPGYTTYTWFKAPACTARSTPATARSCAGASTPAMLARVKVVSPGAVPAVDHAAVQPDRGRQRAGDPAAPDPDRERKPLEEPTDDVHHRLRHPSGSAGRRPRGDQAASDQALDRLADHHRSQEDRDHVPGHHLRVLHPRRCRGAADAGPARGAEQHAAQLRALQPAAHASRHDDDLPVRGPGDGRLRELLPALDDRRAGHGLPAPERAVLLAAAARRDRLLLHPVLPPARGRLVELSAALEHPVLAQRRPGRVDLPDPHHRHLLAGRARSTSTPPWSTCARPA